MDSKQSRGSAIVLANGVYKIRDGKVAHGLVRGSSRFHVIGVVEPELAGQDAGEALDGVHRGIPILSSIADALGPQAEVPEFCVIGVAPHGVNLNEELPGMVQIQIAKELPFPAGEAVIDFVGAPTLSPEETMTDVLVAAVRGRTAVRCKPDRHSQDEEPARAPLLVG